MSPSTDAAQLTPAQDLVAQIRNPVFKEQIEMVLPPTITSERFIRIATTAVMTNPEIAKMERNSVLRAFVQSAAAGLMPDGKEAAIVGRGGAATFQPMIYGRRKVLADYGWSLRTRAVYENDRFEWTEEPPSLIHQPLRPGQDRGRIIGAYAIATHTDGRRFHRFMAWEDIEKRRAIATTKQVWDKWPAEMAEKTVGHDLFADLPLAEADRERLMRVLDPTGIDPGEATAALYGPRKIAATTETAAAAAASPGNGGDVRQQADDAQPPRHGTPRAEEASPAPGEDEPDLGSPEPAQQSLNDDEQAAIEAAANEAAIFTLDRGKHRDKTLGEIAHIEGSDGWFVWGLRQTELPAVMSTAIWNFCRVYKPALFNQVLAEREAQAAA